MAQETVLQRAELGSEEKWLVRTWELPNLVSFSYWKKLKIWIQLSTFYLELKGATCESVSFNIGRYKANM